MRNEKPERPQAADPASLSCLHSAPVAQGAYTERSPNGNHGDIYQS